ncbi:MAG TPA: hypothetical protein VG271_06245, partial [Beijerinckiaceae bacterium]|nr:hypothetical protein [Beijerinckiaceae bacterium]
MGEPSRQYQPVDLLEFKRRLQARVESALTSSEDPLEEMARIIGGNGHIIPANADVRPEPIFEETRFAEARAETLSEPGLALTTFAAHAASPHLVTDEQADLSLDPTDDIESDRAKWTPPSVRADDRLSDQTERDEELEANHPAFDVEWQELDAAVDQEGDAFAPSQSNRAYLRLRNHRRRNISLYATSAAALVVAGALVAIFVRPGVSVGVAPVLGPTST